MVDPSYLRKRHALTAFPQVATQHHRQLVDMLFKGVPVRRARWPLAWLTLAAVIAVCIIFGRAFIHFWGIDTQQSDNYDYWSGVGPCLISALGLSTLIAGMWRHVNCHKPGCLRIGKHKVGGTPWCTRHHGEARADLDPVAERLDRIIELLEQRSNGE